MQFQKRRDDRGGEYFAVVGLGTCEELEIVIPATHKGLPVKEIATSAFDSNRDTRATSLISISIPDSVTSIGDRAFGGCSGLTSITIPASVTLIGNRAFGGCSGLTGVYITDLAAWCRIDFEGNWAANLLSPARHLYWNGEEAKNLTIPAGITEIKPYTFYGFCGLESVTIPDGVTEIGDSAFYFCSGLTSITIPNSVTSIGSSAFSSCNGLTSITIPNSVTSIGSSAFFSCNGLTSITIPNSVTEIGAATFEYCSGLESVTIGSGVTSIGERAFHNCSGLTSITIPDGVTEIGAVAFSGCSGLTSVYYTGTPDDWAEMQIASYNSDLTNATRYYYSAEENTDGQHWHYDPATGKPVVWTKEEA